VDFLSNINDRLAVARLYQKLLLKKTFFSGSAEDRLAKYVDSSIKGFIEGQLNVLLGLTSTPTSETLDENETKVLKALVANVSSVPAPEPPKKPQGQVKKPSQPKKAKTFKVQPEEDLDAFQELQLMNQPEEEPETQEEDISLEDLEDGLEEVLEEEPEDEPEVVQESKPTPTLKIRSSEAVNPAKSNKRVFKKVPHPETGDMFEMEVTGLDPNREYKLVVNPNNQHVVAQDVTPSQVGNPSKKPQATFDQMAMLAQSTAATAGSVRGLSQSASDFPGSEMKLGLASSLFKS
jgi:hypothetical protein